MLVRDEVNLRDERHQAGCVALRNVPGERQPGQRPVEESRVAEAVADRQGSRRADAALA
jgi:hypothetical protein